MPTGLPRKCRSTFPHWYIVAWRRRFSVGTDSSAGGERGEILIRVSGVHGTLPLRSASKPRETPASWHPTLTDRLNNYIVTARL